MHQTVETMCSLRGRRFHNLDYITEHYSSGDLPYECRNYIPMNHVTAIFRFILLQPRQSLPSLIAYAFLVQV